MRAHLPFSLEEQTWRERYMDVSEVPEHHFAAAEAPSIEHASHAAFAQPVHGFDVSSYQPPAPDFSVGGRRFAIFKATEATGYFDPHFAANRTKAHALGLPFVGMYHFARPGSHTADAEAAYFLAHVGTRQPGECAVLDYETSPWSVPWIVRWMQLVQAAGWPVEFYSYLGMLSANATDGIPQTGCGLWVAAYGCREPGSDRWPQKDLWQHTDGSGSVCGNDGGWDCSIGSADVLSARVGTAPTPPTPTPPVPPPPPPPPPPVDDVIEENDHMSQTNIEPGKRRAIAITDGAAGTVRLTNLYGGADETSKGHLWLHRHDGSVSHEEDVTLTGNGAHDVTHAADVVFANFQNGGSFVVNLARVPASS